MIHLLAQLDPMVWLMMVVVAIGFAVSAAVLVELLPPGSDRPPAFPPTPDGEADAPGPLGHEHDDRETPPV